MTAQRVISLLCLVFAVMEAKKSKEFDDLNKRATAERVDTGYDDPNPHYVDIPALRDMSIKAYMEGGNYDDLHEWGVTKQEMSLSLCAAVFCFSIIMMCCCHQCQKHLMRDFYKLEYKARKEAELRALEKQRALADAEYDYAAPPIPRRPSDFQSPAPPMGDEIPDGSGAM